MRADDDLERVKKACADLSEFFDSVQIFATRLQDKDDGEEGTVNVAHGSGNWFARAGQVSEWMLKNQERAKIEVRSEDD